MDSRSTVLGSTDMDSRGVEVDLLPAKVDKLTDSEGVPECHEDQEPIADRVAAVTGGGDQAVDLALGPGTRVPGSQCSWLDQCELSAFQTARAVIG